MDNLKIEDEQALTDALNKLAEVIESINVKAGWTEERTVGDDIALIQSEASEALEAFRECGDATKRWYSHTYEYENGFKIKGLTRDQVESLNYYYATNVSQEQPKPEGVGSELADIIIRTLNTATRRNIPIAAELIEKVHYNATRGHRHGNKHL